MILRPGLSAGAAPESSPAGSEDAGDAPLAHGQRALWFLHLLSPESAAYNLAAAMRVHSPLDLGALRRGVAALVERHDALRSTFHGAGDEPVRRVHERLPPDYREVDASGWSEAAVTERLVREAYRPFDLEAGPLLRVRVLEGRPGGPLVLFALHHIVADFWSLALLARQLGELLGGEAQRRPPAPELPSRRFRDYVDWQRRRLSGDRGERLWAYWRGQLAGAPSALELPADRPRPPVQTYRGAAVNRRLGGAAAAGLAALARSRGATVFTVLLAAFQALLHRYTGQDDLVVGSPTAGRSGAAFARLVGYLVNAVALRARLAKGESFESFLDRTRETVRGALEHQHYPLSLLAERLHPERDASRSPLFQAMLVFQRAPREAKGLAAFALGEPRVRISLGALQVESLRLEDPTAQFDLVLAAAELEGTLALSLRCNTDLFDSTTARRMLCHFEVLAAGAVADAGRRVAALPLLRPAEARQLLSEWSGAAGVADTEGAGCLHQLVEVPAGRAPEATALVCADEHLSYGRLNARANRLACRLRSAGVGPEVCAGVLLERSPEMVVALLGVLKAGGAYVPLDPAYPEERLAFMLADARVAVLLGAGAATPPGSPPVVRAGGRDEEAGERASGPPPLATPRNLAYVIYTSGSTGRPKGVAIEHRSPVTLVRWALGVFSRGELSRVLASTSISFDLSVFELFAPLAAGGTVVLVRNALELAAAPEAREVTLVNTVPSAMAELVRMDALPASARAVGLAGEPLRGSLARRIHEQGPRRRLFNLYGPSEDTTYSTFSQVRPGAAGEPSIGRPVDATRAYVVDAGPGPVPAGVAGQLLLAGGGLARGYLGRPGATAEKFLPDPFAGSPGARAYATGDLTKWSPAGCLEFLGRVDHQVKVRGYRVELGEVESALAAHPAVREAAVVLRGEGSGGRLAAYVAAAGVGAGELRRFLGKRLPDYMQPAVYDVLEALPLTANGKIDRAALARRALPSGSAEALSGGLDAPRTAVEELVASVWQEVLGRDRVGRGESFFELGGHSLLATRAMSRLARAFGVEVPLSSLFEAPTVAGLAARIESARRRGGRPATPPILPVAPRAGPPPASFAQERLWFLHQLEPASSAYHVAAGLRLRGRLAVAALEAAVNEIVRRHEALRTSFTMAALETGTPVQVIAETLVVGLPLSDLSSLPAARREAELGRLNLAEAGRPFDLSRGPLLRVGLARLGRDDHALSVTMHHVVSDGWSLGVLVREVGALYEAFAAGRPSPLPALPIQYADFAAWQRRWLRGKVLEAQMRYWREELAGAPALELPTDRPRPARQSLRGGELPVLFGEGLTRALRALSRSLGATLYMALLAAFQALLFRHSGQDELTVGSPVANRSLPEAEELIGCFVNTLVLRGDLSGAPTFAEHLSRVRTRSLGAYAHQDVPFERLVEALQPQRDLSRSPLFQVMLVLQNAPMTPPALAGLRVTRLAVPSRASKFDLTLSLEEIGGSLSGSLEYAAELFDSTTVRRLLRHLETLLAEAAAAPDRRVAELPLLADAERGQLLREWNDARAAGEACLPELFEAQAGRTPEATALAFGEERLSYRELDRRAGRLARWLRSRGVGPEARVGILLARSPAMVVGLLGTWKAGGAYVPLDPSYPEQRLALMREDARVAVLVTGEPSAVDEADLLAHPGPRDLAYVIYTSGSTGRPKGVAIEHASAAALVRWALEAYSAGELARVLASTSICFDLSVFELFVPLAAGGTVVLVEDVLDLASRPEAGEVSLVNTVPSALAELVDAIPSSVHTVNLAGEPLRGALVRRLRDRRPDLRVMNLYGPSEDTTYSTAAEMGRGEEAEPSIGRGVAGTRVHLLDGSSEPVPVGVSGQLHLGGRGLARGYLGRPGATADRFGPDPFGAEPGARLYATGDLGRRLPDGRVSFLGRADRQVKVRGFRVELGEVEAALAAHDEVREAAVLAREDGAGGRLVAFVAARPGSGERLRRDLRATLPGYMVPQSFVFLEALPRLPNGKVDRRALGGLSAPASELPEEAREGPRTPQEEIVAAVWSELLGVERVSRHADFFALGGHSLLATRALSRLRHSLGVDLPLKVLFERPTVAALAAAVEEGAGGDRCQTAPPLGPRSREDGSPLSFAQERLWFLDRWEPGSAWYNVPAALRIGPLPGAARPGARLDVALLRRCLNAVAERHEALRARFPSDDGRPQQVISPSLSLALPTVDLGALDATSRARIARRLAAEEARRPFDLAEGPLLRVLALRLSPREQVLLVTLHHIAADGWSIGVLTREVAALYRAFARGAAPTLPALPIQYADFAVWQRRWLSGERLERQVRYWRERLAGLPALELPTDRPRPSVPSSRGASLSFFLPRELADALAAFSRRAGATPFMTLLAAFGTLLGRHTGQTDLSVGTPVAGRSRVEVEGLIGCFVNTLVLRSDLAGDPAFLALVGRVREAALAAYHHQEVPFEKLVEELRPERALASSPLYQVMLVLQNAPAEAPELPGLAVEPLELESVTTKLDLTLFVEETARGIAARVVYDSTLFLPTTIARLAGHWRTLLSGILEAPARRLSELPLVPAGERHQLLAEWNAARPAAGGMELPFHRLFEAWAQRVPDSPAVVFEEERLTYGELARRAERLARRLRRLGVGAEERVGLCTERSAAAVTAILGVLAAGGAYVPLDPRHPPPRLAFMLADSRAALVLAQAHLVRLLPRDGPPVLDLEDADGPLTAAPAAPRPAGPAELPHLAYVIYTSGSTGRPKGVGVEHRQVASYVRGLLAHPEVPAGGAFATVSSLAADLGNTAIFAALATGGTLHVVGEERLADFEALAEYGRRHPLDGLKIVPSHLAAFLSAPGSEHLLPRRCLILGGEAASWDLLARVRSLAPSCRVLNHYGPTEATVGVLTCRLDGEAGRGPAGAAMPIGRPMAEARVHLADSRLVPAPLGTPAEGYLGGAHLARGYLGHPRTTAERFVPDPFGRQRGARLYRTGDRLRYRADGRVEFLGRVDQQIKVRGFRVEPGEVEAALLALPGVREAAVQASAEGAVARRLVAYVAGPGAGDRGELRRRLGEVLPEHMTPAAFVALEALPRTTNGKVDRAALSRLGTPPERARPGEAPAPRTPVEEIVAGIWSELLGLSEVGRADDFFALGGHSLLAAQAISRVRAAFGREVPLRALFEAPTLAAFAERVERATREAAGVEVPPLRPAPRDGEAPLSFAQERLWFLEQLSPGLASYNVPAALALRGRLSIAVLAGAFRELVRRHEVLRTSLVSRDGTPRQVIAPSATVALAVVDLAGLAGAARKAELGRLAREEAQRPFDLARGPLLRLKLLVQAREEHTLLSTLHHVVSDGWSTTVLIRELTALYRALAAGEPSPLPPLAVQYADFARWQREWLAGDALAAGLRYWRGRLSGALPVLELPADRRRPALPSHRGARWSFPVTAEVSNGLGELSGREAATLFMVLAAAFQALLLRYTGQRDLMVGFPVASRDRLEIEGLIGFFVNMLPLRLELSGAAGRNPSFREVLSRVRREALMAYAHQEVPFEKLLHELRPDRDLARAPLFQATFALQIPLGSLDLPELTVLPLDPDPGTAKFDLSLIMAPAEAGLAGTLEYSTDLFDATTVRRLAGHLRTLFGGIVADPGRGLAELPLLAGPERAQLVVELNDTRSSHGGARGVHELVAARVELAPDAVAVAAGRERLSYRQLGARAGRLARALARLGVGPEAVAGVFLERSPEMVVALFAILKAGGAYLPIDPAYPAERVAFLLADARAPVIVTRRGLAAGLPAAGTRVLLLDGAAAAGGAVPAAPRRAAGAGNLAYVIYTSGSTGRPKGVAVTHRSLLNLVVWYWRFYGVTASGRGSLLAGVGFDASVLELWPLLAAGASLAVPDEETRLDAERLADWLAANGVTHAFLPTALAEAALAAGRAAGRLRYLLTGGDRLRLHPPPGLGFVLANNYGPTEATVLATACLLPADVGPGAAPPPIGRPMDNAATHVLDRCLRPVPAGVAGEIAIGGAGVARGYLGRPALTAERFVPDPFARGARLYRTGDLARFLPGGDLEFRGRADHQVKVRGHRIEPGEIEAALGRHPGVRRVAVAARGGGGSENLRLIAYVVPDGDPDAQELRAFLRRQLPDHMVPSLFVFLADLPLTPHGKVDRRALPSPDAAGPEREFVAPRTPVEESLAMIWSKVLNVERVGVEDDFFEVGGHSLLATQLASQIRRILKVSLPLRALFQARTLAEMADAVVRHEAAPGQTEKIARLLKRLEGMSPEEVREALARRRERSLAAS